MDTEIIEGTSENGNEDTEVLEITELTIEEEAPVEEIDIGHSRKIIEAILFAAGYPVSYEKLGQAIGTTPGAAKRIVREYAEEYDTPLERGITLLCYENTCQLCTKEQYGTYIREALGIKRGGNLSQSSIETLAIIAYNAPVTRAFVDTVRGVDSAYAMTSLLDKQLIKVCGRLDVPGRPRLFCTTDNFLRVFGLSSLDELPEVGIPGVSVPEQLSITDDGEKKEN